MVATLLYAVDCDKAYSIDDSLFLTQAAQVLADPWQPLAGEVVWDYRVGRASELSPSGVAMAYLLAPVVLLGAEEWLAHLLVTLLLMAAAIAVACITVRLGLEALEAAVATLLVVSMPTVLGMASTVMPDIAALTFGAWGVERALAFRTRRRLGAGVASAVLVGLAAHCRPHALLLALVVAAFTVDDGWAGGWRGVAWRRAWPAVGGIVAFGLGILVTRDEHAAGGNLAAVAAFANLERVPKNLVGFFAHLVFALPLTLPYLAVRWRRLPWGVVGAAVGLGLAALWQFGRLRWWYAAGMAGLSVGVLADVMLEGLRRRDRLQLILGGWLLVALPVAIYVHLPSKFLMISAPAVSLVVVRVAGEWRPGPRRGLWLVTWASSCLLGLAIVRADAADAESGRRAAEVLIRPRTERGEPVWYFGHWGYQFYAEQAGARPILPTPPYAAKGDVIVGSGGAGHPWLKRYARRLLATSRLPRAPGGRVMGGAWGAGFYSDAWGYLPWSYGDEPLPTFSAWRVER